MPNEHDCTDGRDRNGWLAGWFGSRATLSPNLACRDEANMSNDNQPHASSSGAVIAIVAVVVLLMLGGLLVLGLAGLFFFRVSVRSAAVAPPPPRMVEQRVMVQPAQPIDWHPDQQAQTAAEASPPSSAIRRVAVTLDPQGEILAGGQAVDVGGLKELLVKAREDGTISLEVVVEVNRQCLFEHVARVQAVCKEAGVENVRVQALTTSQD